MTKTVEPLIAGLKPCPICNGQPVRNGSQARGAFGYFCRDKNHVLQTYGKTEEDARTAWNTRLALSNGGDRDMAAFGASDAACYLYPGEDQQAERAAFCAGAAHGGGKALSNGGEATSERFAHITREQFPEIIQAARWSDESSGTEHFEPGIGYIFEDPDGLSVPVRWLPYLPAIEAALASLDHTAPHPLDVDAIEAAAKEGAVSVYDTAAYSFVCGEHTPMMAMAHSSQDLWVANRFLTEYFEGWDFNPAGGFSTLTDRDAIRAEAGWQDISTARAMDRCFLWCADLDIDKRPRGLVTGRIVEWSDGTRRPYADGMNGDWTFTHWMPPPPPPSLSNASGIPNGEEPGAGERP